MGEALVRGLINGGWAPAHEIVVVESSSQRRAVLGETLTGKAAGVVVTDSPVAAEGTMIATKPPQVAGACAEAAAAGTHRVLSIAAGVKISALEKALAGGAGGSAGGKIAVVRAMPNTPSLVGAGAAAIAGGTHAGPEDLEWASGILGAVGSVVTVSEGLLDAVTGVSGSGPAYIFLIAEALIEAGVLAGLPRPTAHQLATQTIMGAGRMLVEAGENPEVLRAAVTSPGGTTAAALRALEAGAVRSSMIDAVLASAQRSQELGD